MAARSACISAVALALIIVGVVAPARANQTTSATPAAAASPSACPMPKGSAIPGATFFAPWGLGSSPVWAVGLGTPPEPVRQQLPATPPSRDVFGPGAVGPTRDGWFLRVLWVIAPGTTEPVTLRGRSAGGESLRFDISNRGVVTTAVLDPGDPPIPIQQGGWAEFPSDVYFPATGCYELEARWAGGGWSVQLPFVAPEGPRAASPVAGPGGEATPTG